MLQQWFTCTYQGHENEPIVGFCLDQNCRQKPQYCNRCIVSFHSDHIQNCKSVMQLKQMIQSLQAQINEWSKHIDHEFVKIQLQYQLTVKQLTDESNRIQSLQQELQNEEYQQIVKRLFVIKQISAIQTEQKKEMRSDNFTNMLTELSNLIHTFSDTKQEENQIDQQIAQENIQISFVKVDQDILFPQKGITHKLQKEYNQAINCFDEAIKFNYNNSSAHREKGTTHVNLGGALIELKNYEKAINSLDKAIKLNQKDSVSFCLKGLAHYKIKFKKELILLRKYKESIQYFDRAIELDPKYSFALSVKASALLGLRKNEAANDVCDQAIRLNPQSSQAFNNKGIALQNLKIEDEAQLSYEEAINLDRNDVKAKSNLGILLFQQKKYDQALSCIDQAINIDKTIQNAYIIKGEQKQNLGQILSALEKIPEAIECFDKVLQLNPQHPIAKLQKDKIISVNIGAFLANQ